MLSNGKITIYQLEIYPEDSMLHTSDNYGQ